MREPGTLGQSSAVGVDLGTDVRKRNFEAGQALAEMVRTTLGPKGLDTMLVTDEGQVVVTNDGASIVDRLDVDHPAARLVVEVADSQDARTGDGTTSAIVLTGELLGNAESLVDRGVHPTRITRGYHLAAARAAETVDELALPVDTGDDDQLRNVARTVVTGKWDEAGTEFLADRAVEAVRTIQRDGQVEFERITRTAIPGESFYDSELLEGVVVDMDQSSTTVVSPAEQSAGLISDATVALVDREMTVSKPQEAGTVTFDSFEGYDALRERERETYQRYVDHLTGVGADVVFCQQSIDDRIRSLLAEESVLAVERTRRDELHKLARATGAQPVDRVEDLTTAAVGRAPEVEQRPVGPTAVTVVSGTNRHGHVSLLARGGTERVAAETKRKLDDCFYVLKLAVEDEAVLPGGGAIETALARDLRTYAAERAGREQLAVEGFADALEVIPRTLAESAGRDPIDVLVALHNAHQKGRHTVGVDVQNGEVGDVTTEGVLEPRHVKRQALTSAAEAAAMIVRVDDAVPATLGGEDHDHEDENGHDHGPGDLVHDTEGYPWAVGHST